MSCRLVFACASGADLSYPPSASIVAFNTFPLLGTYSASKWYVKGFTQVAAKEWAVRYLATSGGHMADPLPIGRNMAFG